VIAKKIEVPTKKTKAAQKSTKEHRTGQTGTKWDKKTKTAQKSTKFQRDEANRILKVPPSNGETAL
jgi:hypothetical protein